MRDVVVAEESVGFHNGFHEHFADFAVVDDLELPSYQEATLTAK